MKLIYPAVFHKEDGVFWGEFPDLEGCNSFGDTLEEILTNAREALEGYSISLIDTATAFTFIKKYGKIGI